MVTGFVDHHTHLLSVAARRRPGYDVRVPGSIADYHRRLAASGTTPMDDVFETDGVDDLEAAFERSLSDAASLGLVGITEAGLRDWTHWDALIALRASGRLPIAVHVLVASGLATGERSDPDRLREAVAQSDERLGVAGVKFYGDGWLGPRTCACSESFADVPSPGQARGVLFRDADELARVIEPIARDGLRPATHAIGDRAIETVLDAYEQVYGGAAGVRAHRPRIEHAQMLRPDLIDRIVDLGVVCCIQPCFAASDAPSLEQAFGDRYPMAYRWDALLDAGAAVIAGSDFPIETLDPAAGLDALTSGSHPLAPEQAMAIMTVPLTSA